MTKDFIVPIVVLSGICLFVSGALAFTNGLTLPVIAQAEAERTEAARMAIMPDAAGFERVEAESLPRSITEVYRATNDIGYLFMISVNGYGGEMRLMCGIDHDGTLIRAVTLSQNETRSFFRRMEAIEPDFIGKDSRLEGIDTISGATITSSAYINGIRDAFAAFETIRGRSND